MDVYSLAVRFAAPAVGLIENVLHYELDSSQTEGPLSIAHGLADSFKATVLPELLKLLSIDMEEHSISVRRVSAGGGPTYTAIGSTIGADPNPLGDTGVSLNIALLPLDSPFKVGHFYLCGIPDGMLFQNTWDTGYIQKVKNFGGALLLPLLLTIGQGNANLVIWHRKLKNTSKIAVYDVRGKPTAMNRRLSPYP